MQKSRNCKPCQSFNFDITYRCQLHCRHCYNCSGSQDFGGRELEDREVLEMVDDVMKLKPQTVWLCGGEPLLRIGLIDQILTRMPHRGMCHMLTNGWGMTDEIASELKTGGIGTVQISLDGANPDTHNWMRENEMAYDHAINAIQILKKHGIHTSVACTPCKRNFPEMNDIIDLCLSYHVDELKFQTMRELGRAHDITDSFLSEHQYQSIRDLLKRRKKEAEESRLLLEWGDSDSYVKKLREGQIACDINISAYGELLLSPYLPVTLGNVRKHPVSKYLSHGFADLGRNLFIQKAVEYISGSEGYGSQNLLPEPFSGANIDFDLFEHENMSSYGKELIEEYQLDASKDQGGAL